MNATLPTVELPPTLRFISGVGDPEQGTACVMSAAALKVHLQAGGSLSDFTATDRLDCVCPVLRRLAIRANDGPWWSSDEERTAALLPWVDKLIGSRVTPEATLRRAYLLSDLVVRTWVPDALESLGRKNLADRLRAIEPIVDRPSAEKARDVTWPVREEARKGRAAAAAADADADAAAAYAAAAYAYADAYAADADAAAYAAAYAADAYAYAAAAYAADAAAAYAAAAAAAADADADADAYAYAYAADADAAARKTVHVAWRTRLVGCLDQLLAVQ
jgi:hypothetical protein